MVKIKKLALAFLLLIIAISPATDAIAGGTCYDFLLWTESDTPGDLTINATSITITTMDWSSSSRVSADFGASYWSGDFLFMFDTSCNWSLTNGGEYGLLWVSDYIDGDRDYNHASGALRPNVGLYMAINSGYNPSFVLNEVSGGSLYQTTGFVGSKNTRYYCTLYRDESTGTYGTLFLKVYSDSARTLLLSTSSLALHSKQDFRYLITAVGRDYSSGYGVSGDIQNLCSYSALYPTATTGNVTWSYIPIMEIIEAEMYGNVADDGGDAVTACFYYREDISANWSWAGTSGTYSTGENFSATLLDLELNKDYEYFARITNESGTDDGDIETFSTNQTAGPPVVTTLGYPIDIGANTTAYGQILDDGGENCTGWIEYRIGDTGNFTSTNTTSGLQIGDLFGGIIYGVTEDVTYQYRAVANNTQGTTNGSISYFYWNNAVEPTLDTLQPTEITSTGARVSVNITDDGGATTHVSMLYRRSNVSTWSETTQYMGETGDVLYWHLTGLAPSTQYYCMAKGFSQGTWNGTAYEYVYGDEVGFYTSAAVAVPLLDTTEVGYLNEDACYCKGEILDDGGSLVNVWFQYRVYGETEWIDVDSPTEFNGLTEGLEVTWYIGNLEYGQSYEVRIAGQNDTGIGYGDKESYTHATQEDIDAGNISAPPGWVNWLSVQVLGPLGMNNTGGKLFATIFVALVVFLLVALGPSRGHDKHTRKLFGIIASCLALLIIVLGMVINYIPQIMTLGVLIAAAGTLAVIGVRIFTGSRSRGE